MVQDNALLVLVSKGPGPTRFAVDNRFFGRQQDFQPANGPNMRLPETLNPADSLEVRFEEV
jgi:hypothetical protein